MHYEISTGHSVEWQEIAELLRLVGWGDEYEEGSIQRSIRAYPFVALARNTQGMLLGYLTAFSDGVFSTTVGEIVVHPEAQGVGIGRALLSEVETKFPSVPIYVNALGEAKRFFEACGYRIPRTEMTVMFKKTGAINPSIVV